MKKKNTVYLYATAIVVGFGALLYAANWKKRSPAVLDVRLPPPPEARDAVGGATQAPRWCDTPDFDEAKLAAFDDAFEGVWEASGRQVGEARTVADAERMGYNLTLKTLKIVCPRLPLPSSRDNVEAFSRQHPNFASAYELVYSWFYGRLLARGF